MSEESPTSNYPLRVLILVVLVMTGAAVLLARLHEFQVTRHDEMLAAMPKPSKVTTRLPGTRGRILDREGVVLARNRPSFEVDINLETLVEAYRRRSVERSREAYLQRDVDGIPRQREREDVVKIFNDFLVPRLMRHGLAANYNASALRNHYVTHRGLVPFTYREDLEFEEFAKFAERGLELPGVEVVSRPRREYPFGSMASHVLGYVKRWGKGNVPAHEQALFNHYVGDEEGVAGIEKSMNEALIGAPGRRVWLRDERGHFVRVLEETPAGRGADLQLTLDARLQYLVEEQMQRVGRGAAVVLDVETGEVLAMASVPNLDPNDFIPSITQARFDGYRRNEARPFTNRAVSVYEPGSTFKLGSALSGCKHGLRHRQFHCAGRVKYGNTYMHCWIHAKGGQHGTLGLSEAIQRSCNCYFYLLANALGPEKLSADLQELGFGQRTGIELTEESGGTLPGSSWWRHQRGMAKLTPALNAQLAIGQGDTQASPLQMAVLTAAVANGGKLWQPRLVKQYQSQNDDEPSITQPILRADLIKLGYSQADLSVIAAGMHAAANKAGGTARAAALEEYQVCAKTGTAQSIDRGRKSHNAWTVAYAPYENPRYAVAVMVRAGKAGGDVAAPLVNRILRGAFELENQPLPVRPLPPYPGDLRTVVSVSRDSMDVQTEGGLPSRAVLVNPADAAPRRAVRVTPATLSQPSVRPDADTEGSIVRQTRQVRPQPPRRVEPRRVTPEPRRAVIVNTDPPRRAVPVESDSEPEPSRRAIPVR